ncbi:peptidoglycan recognition protein [Holotrichia oblita]|uniref:Peptidoglycan recognition protein n=1 Tax=Holotrichia oblita TaxID=644536 RepID=A0ACB9T4X1_HOLOL|nr:peptidoglycan recognition protein [Holotrichia oblita]
MFVLFLLNLDDTFADCPKILSKDYWGGQAATHIDYVIKPVKYIIIHHTVTQQCLTENDCSQQLINIQSYHMNDLSLYDIGYNFIIGGDGNIYEGVGWHKEGAHTYGYNKKSIGDFLNTCSRFFNAFLDVAPNKKQLEAGQKLIECAVEKGEVDRTYKLMGARSVSATESPGLALFRVIQNWRGFTRNA